MTACPPAQAGPAPAAMTAFLRGVERRATLFAELQCGDAGCGDAALAAALHDFAAGARQRPVADWPRCFWSLLLAAPSLRGTPAQPRWPAPFGSLAGLGHGPRAALLLRLVAGLEETDAAAVLGIAEPTYRLALRRAAPRRVDGSADADAWRALDRAACDALRHQLPVPRMLQLAQWREAALSARGSQPPPAAPLGRRAPGSRSGRPRWLLPSLRIALAVCVLAFVATFLWPDAWLPQRAAGQRIQRAALPATDAPQANFDAATALLSHRDFEQLLFEQTAAASDRELLRDLEFYSWYAAAIAAQPASALPLPDAAQPLPGAAAGAQEGSDATP